MVAKIKKLRPSHYVIYHPWISRICQGGWKKRRVFLVKICKEWVFSLLKSRRNHGLCHCHWQKMEGRNINKARLLSLLFFPQRNKMNHKGRLGHKEGTFLLFWGAQIKRREEKKRDRVFKSRVSAVSARFFCFIVFSLSRQVCYKNLHDHDRAFARRCGMIREG
jgi:hypothetical protein